MFKPVIAALLACGFAVSVQAQTLADQSLQLDAQISILQKQRQLQDQLGADPILSKMPQVVSVMTFGEQTKAKLMLASGVALTYAEGEVINQRMRMVAITPREVVVAITPTERAAGGKSKKAKDPVLMPLEFMAGARQNQMDGAGGNPGMPGMPGVPGTPVSGPIPPGLMQAPPAVAGGGLANWPQVGAGGRPAGGAVAPAMGGDPSAQVRAPGAAN